jgi:hypothetical protein
MKKITFLMLWACCLLYVCPIKSQTAFVNFHVYSLENDSILHLSHALINLTDAEDSHKIAETLYTTENGYCFKQLDYGNYLYEANYMGYQKRTGSFMLNSDTDTLQVEIELSLPSHLLNDIVIEASQTQHKDNKTVEYFTNEQVKSAQTGLNLIALAPQLYLDPQSNEIKERNNQSLLILINGIKASSAELKNIPPEKIIRLDYYDVPTAQYINYDRMIDVVTRRLDTGFGFGGNLAHATATGFANDGVYFSYVRGNHQIAFNYDMNWRNYKDNTQEHDYTFALSGNNYNYRQSDKGGFDYWDNNLNLRYNYVIPDKWTFQVKFTPKYRKDHDHLAAEYSIGQNESIHNRYGRDEKESKVIRPTLGVYSQYSFAKDKNLYAEVVGTYFKTNQDNAQQQFYDKGYTDLALDNFLKSDSRKRSLIAEAYYMQTLTHQNSIELGGSASISRSSANIRNILNGGLPYKYIVNGNDYSVYASYSQKVKRLYYRAQLTYLYLKKENSEVEYSKPYLSPYFTARYTISDTQNISFLLNTAEESPSISQLTETANLYMDNIISYGNPSLRPHQRRFCRLSYNYAGKYLNFTTYPYYRNIHNAMVQRYTPGTYNELPVMALETTNAKRYEQTGVDANLAIYPLGKRTLAISASYEFLHSSVKIDGMDTYSSEYHGAFFSARYTGKVWGANVYYRIPGWRFSSLYRSKDENNKGIDLYYNYKAFRLSAQWMFLGTASSYTNETFLVSPMHEKWSSRVGDNKNMIAIGISWNLNKGKTLRVNKSINNSDNDSGLI